MTSWRSYLWKEYRQNRRLGLVALGLFLGTSFIPSIVDSIRHDRLAWYDGSGLSMLLLGGPILAMVAGVCAMGREQGAIECFWRSQPVKLNRWLLSKYVTGLALVWLVCWMPLLIQIAGWAIAERYDPLIDSLDSLDTAPLYSFILLLIYSASFVLGHCIRGLLHAAILSVGAMAMIYIIPLVVAPLSWLSIEALQRADAGTLDARSFIAFAAAMTALSIALLWLAGVLFRRNVRIDVDRRTLSWSVVVMLLVLATATAFPMSTNLPAQQVVPLPVTQNVMVHDMVAEGNEVLILLSSGAQPYSGNGRKHGLVRVHIREQNSVVDEPLWFADPGQGQGFYYTAFGLAWPAENPSLAYALLGETWPHDRRAVDKRKEALCVVALDAKRSDPIVHRLDLSPLLSSSVGWLTMCLDQHLLYVCNETGQGHLLTFSSADPETPTLTTNQKVERRLGLEGPGLFRDAPERYQIQLIPATGLDEAARLEVTRRLDYPRWTMAGPDRVVAFVPEPDGYGHRLVLFKAGPARDNVIALQPIAQRRSRTIDQFFGLAYRSQVYYMDRLALQLSDRGVTVYDIGNPPYLKRIGHYAAGERFGTLALLPNHRVIVAGERLHILDLSEQVSAAASR